MTLPTTTVNASIWEFVAERPEDVEFVVSLSRTSVDPDHGVVTKIPQAYPVPTDGEFEMNLWPNSRGEAVSNYVGVLRPIGGRGREIWRAEFEVPESGPVTLQSTLT